MKTRIRSSLAVGLTCGTAMASGLGDPPSVPPPPLVLGHGVGLFTPGPLVAQDNFDSLDNWVVQLEETSGFPPPKVWTHDNTLDCLTPGRGCTIWFKQKLHTRIAITYNVLCPTHEPAVPGVVPRDINNFWLATDPLDPERGLFDPTRYTGNFGSYDKMHGYYASTGGGSAARANRTTRMRRYPREIDGLPTEHLALNFRDEQPGFLITPNQTMAIQLVAYDDVIQYIVDGKLNYQIARGDSVFVEKRDPDTQPTLTRAIYDPDRFPVYREGYFGFRMVRSHHIYTQFRVWELEAHNDRDVGVQ